MGTSPVRLQVVNPVDKPTAATGHDLAEVYHLGGAADATVIPHGHHKTAYDRKMAWDVVVDDKTEVKRETLEFMKTANKLVNGKLRFGHVVSYKEAEDLMKTESLPEVHAVQQYAAGAPVVGVATPLASVPGVIQAEGLAGVAQKPQLPVQSKVDVSFRGSFGRLKVRYDDVFVQGINLVLVQNGGADYEPPNTGDQPIGIEALGKRYICLPGTRLNWPDGSRVVDLFFIDGEAP